MRRRKVAWVLIIVISILCVLFTGCPKNQSPEEASKSERQASISEEAQRREMSERNEEIDAITGYIEGRIS